MDFPFNTGTFDHGGDADHPTTNNDSYLGKSTVVTVGNEASELEVVEIVDISPEIEQVETTTYNDETWREYGAAKKSLGAIKFTFHHDKDDIVQIRLNDLKLSGNEEQFRVWLPGATRTWFSFIGFVSNVRYDQPKDDIIQGTFAVKPTSEFNRFGI